MREAVSKFYLAGIIGFSCVSVLGLAQAAEASRAKDREVKPARLMIEDRHAAKPEWFNEKACENLARAARLRAFDLETTYGQKTGTFTTTNEFEDGGFSGDGNSST